MYRSRYPDDPGMHNPRHGASMLPSAHGTRRGETTFVERVSNSFTGSMLGMGLVVMGLFIITLNEGMAAHMSWKLEQSLRDIVPLETAQVIFTENNNRLVHVTGQLRTTEPLVDAQFGISVRAVKLRRHVQMYQWIEHMKTVNSDAETQYTYTKEWRSELIDSDNFEHEARHINKKHMSIQGTTFVAVRAYVGNFQLKEALKGRIESFDAMDLSRPAPADPNIRHHNGFFYYGSDPQRPMIGDVRVAFSYAGLSGPQDSPVGPPQTVSIIARQAGGILTSYVSPHGENRELLVVGDYSAEEMLNRHYRLDASLAWYLRLGGWLMMFIGFSFMRLIVFYLMDLVPPLRKIAAFGLTNFNLCVSFSLALYFASLLYLTTRPLRGLAMIAAASVPIVIALWWHRLSSKSSRKI